MAKANNEEEAKGYDQQDGVLRFSPNMVTSPEVEQIGPRTYQSND